MGEGREGSGFDAGAWLLPLMVRPIPIATQAKCSLHSPPRGHLGAVGSPNPILLFKISIR